jgi:hypothetical protein
MRNKFNYFPCEVFREENTCWLDKTKSLIDRLEGQQQTFSPLFQSELLENHADFLQTKNYLTQSCVSILAEQGYDVDRYKYRSMSWGQKLYKNAFHVPHVHPNTQMTVLYFVEAPEGGAFPAFEDPRPGKKISELQSMFSEEINCATPEIYFNNVIPGTILYFNSYLPHKIMPGVCESPTSFLHMTIKADETY